MKTQETATLLLDLDDTLLGSSMDTFIPVYLQALARRMAPYAKPEFLVKTLLAATRIMSKNQEIDRTLQDVFDAEFYPALGLTKEDVQDTIDAFYAEDFPTLQRLTQLRPEAVQLVEKAFERGYRIGIATNPLFPRTAIEQRLEWAGLPVSRYPFDLVPSYQTFHFAKPNPAYYAEFLAQMGWPEGSVVMVGDDMNLDITPARQLGLPVFWISQGDCPSPSEADHPIAHGSLAEFLPWLDEASPESLQPDFSTTTAMLAILYSTPGTLDILTAGLPDNNWTQRPEPNEWCPTEIACHLRDVEVEVNLPRTQKVIRESNPFLPGMDTDPWAKERQYMRQNGMQALHAFTTARRDHIYLLNNLKPEDWDRFARHTIFGPTRLKELVGIVAGHDRLHVRQMAETIHTLRSK